MQVNNVYKCDKCGKEYRSNDYGIENKIVLRREFYEQKEYDLCDRCIRYYRDVFITSLRKYQHYCNAIEKNALLWITGEECGKSEDDKEKELEMWSLMS